jgi:hypothetical protein
VYRLLGVLAGEETGGRAEIDMYCLVRKLGERAIYDELSFIRI